MIGKLLAKKQENTKISLATVTVKSGQFGSNPVEVFWPKSTTGTCSLTILIPGLERKWKILFFNDREQSVLYDVPSVETLLVLYFTCLFL